MKRFHVHIAVEKLDDSIRFYSSLFGVARPWCSPITPNGCWRSPREFCDLPAGKPARHQSPGFSGGERCRTASHARATGSGRYGPGRTNRGCLLLLCPLGQVLGDGPAGVAWETFHTLDTIPMYGEDTRTSAMQSACCIPLPQFEGQSESSACCIPLAESTASGPDKACCMSERTYHVLFLCTATPPAPSWPR